MSDLQIDTLKVIRAARANLKMTEKYTLEQNKCKLVLEIDPKSIPWTDVQAVFGTKHKVVARSKDYLVICKDEESVDFFMKSPLLIKSTKPKMRRITKDESLDSKLKVAIDFATEMDSVELRNALNEIGDHKVLWTNEKTMIIETPNLGTKRTFLEKEELQLTFGIATIRRPWEDGPHKVAIKGYNPAYHQEVVQYLNVVTGKLLTHLVPLRNKENGTSLRVAIAHLESVEACNLILEDLDDFKNITPKCRIKAEPSKGSKVINTKEETPTPFTYKPAPGTLSVPKLSSFPPLNTAGPTNSNVVNQAPTQTYADVVAPKEQTSTATQPEIQKVIESFKAFIRKLPLEQRINANSQIVNFCNNDSFRILSTYCHQIQSQAAKQNNTTNNSNNNNQTMNPNNSTANSIPTQTAVQKEIVDHQTINEDQTDHDEPTDQNQHTEQNDQEDPAEENEDENNETQEETRLSTKTKTKTTRTISIPKNLPIDKPVVDDEISTKKTTKSVSKPSKAPPKKTTQTKLA